jgi:N-acetylneuraminic acid mutarotase
LYDPATGVWSATGGLQVALVGHTATLLQDGRVLVVGGYSTGYWDYGAGYVGTSEIYEPSTGTWNYSATSSLSQPRVGHQAVRLHDGKVLVVGGTNDPDGVVNLSTAELYDPAAATWSATGSMAWPRLTPVVGLLQNGKVLVAGGEGLDHMTQGVHTTLSSAEIYDPASKAFTATSALVAGQQGSTASALPDGTILVAGGYSGSRPTGCRHRIRRPLSGITPDTAHRALPATFTRHYGHTATVLIDSRRLGHGGVRGSIDGSKVLSSAEL